MLKQATYSLFTLLALFVLAACGAGPEGESVESGEAIEGEGESTTMEASTYNVDVAASNIAWEGTKKIGGGHNGNIGIADGTLAVVDGKINNGVFTIDMTSITNTDLPEDKQGMLVGHLSNEDFFEVETFPTAVFEIKNVTPASGREDITHMITGNLTMKDNTRSITIPANVEMSDEQISATTPAFVIDRTEWGIQYGSGLLGLAEDEIINDNIGLQITLVANR
ncbi:MAG: YceI family protein [Bacteroidota bacterium]